MLIFFFLVRVGTCVYNFSNFFCFSICIFRDFRLIRHVFLLLYLIDRLPIAVVHVYVLSFFFSLNLFISCVSVRHWKAHYRSNEARCRALYRYPEKQCRSLSVSVEKTLVGMWHSQID